MEIKNAFALIIVAGLSLVPVALAHDPITTKLTWTQEISRIIYKRCISCHREGGVAMSLVSYEEARPWATAIREEVLERRMPPWGAVQGVGAFRDDPSLTSLEVEMIVNWAEGGAPEDDPIYLPKPNFESLKKNPPPALSSVRTLVIRNSVPLTLAQNARAAAVQPLDLPDGASMDITAYLPGGAVEHLIWLRDYRKRWERTYWFRDPVFLPKGTRIVIDSVASASAVISFVDR
ncbi:MAG: hypothetical protein DMG57_06645 [Acidobacteria bacterium]|nr:MAG: hypothetical protein DMG57_06645 [Acidobacteriota bacterium]